jgi:DNA-binding GntR family transcriptional regulator
MPDRQPMPKLASGSLSGIHRVESSTLSSRVYCELRDFLMAGQLQPGQGLTLRELALALGVSPMPVREAVRRLTAEGALETLPNRRVRVLIITEARFRELLDIRIALETLAVAKAAPHIGAAELDRMEELNKVFAAEMARKDADGALLFRINKDLHFIAYEAAGAPALLSMIESMWLQVGPLLHMSLRMQASNGSPRRGTNPAPDWHRRLIAGLRRRDVDAARAAIEGDLTSAAGRILAQGNLPA